MVEMDIYLDANCSILGGPAAVIAAAAGSRWSAYQGTWKHVVMQHAPTFVIDMW